MVVLHNVLRMDIKSCAQPVFEVQPGEDFDLVRHTGLPNAATVDISRAMCAIERSVCITGCVGLAGQLQDSRVGALPESEFMQA
jgi:hypothetical protein